MTPPCLQRKRKDSLLDEYIYVEFVHRNKTLWAVIHTPSSSAMDAIYNDLFTNKTKSLKKITVRKNFLCWTQDRVYSFLHSLQTGNIIYDYDVDHLYTQIKWKESKGDILYKVVETTD